MATTTPSSKSGATSMADLMAKYTTSFNTFHKGDLVKGIITKLTKNEVIVDIGAKTDAIVLEKERSILHTILTTLKIGDEVEVSVLSPESESGNPIVSLRRFLSGLAWETLDKAKKNDEQITVTVTDMTKGGVVASTQNGISGFLPNSHVAGSEQLSPNKTIKVRVLELSRKDNKLVFSQKSTISETEFDSATNKFKAGEKIEVTIANITAFGMFVILPGELPLDGLIHISEMAWEKVDDITHLFTSGQKIEAVIIGFDKAARRVDLSIKRLTVDPFDAIAEKYPVDKKVSVTIIKIDDAGALVDLGEQVEGLIKKEKIPANVTYTEGQAITATVTELDRKRHRVILVPVLLEKPIGYR